MADVKAYDRLGGKIELPEADVPALEKMGGRVATKEELAVEATDAAYDKKSTFQKATSLASIAGPLPFVAGTAYRAATGDDIAPALPPKFEAYGQGISKTFGAGVPTLAMKEIVSGIAGKDAAHAYGQTVKAVEEAHPTAHGLGEVAGFAGSIVAGGAGGVGALKGGAGVAAKAALPGVGISALGGLAERGVARGLASIASKGVAGRAAVTSAEFAARGATEGALYGAANQLTDDMIQDKEWSAERVWAAGLNGAEYGALAGGVLGGAGSLAKAGVMGATGAARGGLARLLAPAERAVVQAEEAAVAGEAKGVAAAEAKVAADVEGGAAKLGEPIPPTAGSTIDKAKGVVDAFRNNPDAATRRAANNLAFDSLGTTKRIARNIDEKVKGGVEAVGDYINRRIHLVDAPETTLMGATMAGRADEMAPRILADRAALFSEIGETVRATPATVRLDVIEGFAHKIIKDLNKDASTIGAGKQLSMQVDNLLEALRNKGALSADGTAPLGELYMQRAALEGAAHEMGAQGQNAAKDATKQWLREMDSHLVEELDKAALLEGKTGVGDKIRSLKRDAHLASYALKAAEDGTHRIEGNNIIGLREGIGLATGVTSALNSDSPVGGVLGAAAVALGGRFMRQRGASLGAVLLSRLANMGTISRAVSHVDSAITKGSKGLLQAPERGLVPAPVGTVRQRADVAVKAVQEAQRDPEAMVARAMMATEHMGTSTPAVRGMVQTNIMRAAAFLASKVPSQAQVDPLDPHPPRMSDSEAASLAEYHAHVLNPMLFWSDLARGKVTHEGAETAAALQPKSFAQLQAETMGQLAELRAQGKMPPFRQRVQLGVLFDIAADPSQRIEHMKFLQANLAATPKNEPGSATVSQATASAAPKRPFKATSLTQPSKLDRLSQ